MRKNYLFRSLLLVVGMTMGISSWADTLYSQNYEGATATDWVSGTGGRFTPVLQTTDGNTYLTVDQSTRNNNGTTLTCSAISVAEGKDFTMTFDLKLGSSNNQSPVVFSILDAANTNAMLSLTATASSATTWNVNAATSQSLSLPGTGVGKGTTITDGIESAAYTWYSFKLSRSGSITYLTVTNKATAEEVMPRTIISTLSTTGGIGKMTFVTKRYYANFAIDNVVVRDLESSDVPTATPTSYTINYVNESGATIKDPLTVATLEGLTVQASDDNCAAVFFDSKKYIYASGNASITTVADATKNVITLVYREATTWNYSIKAVDAEGNTIKELKSGTNFEGETSKVFYSKYFQQDNIWFMTDGNTSYPTYAKSFTAEGSENVTFNTASIAYFSEAEDLTPSHSWAASNGIAPDRYSNGVAVRLFAGSYASTEPFASSGVYKLTLWARNNSSSSVGNVDICTMSSDSVITTLSVKFEDWATANQGTKTVENVEIPAGSRLVLNNTSTYNSNLELDYIVLEKTGEATGINEVADKAADSAAFYNIQGMKVKSPVKGLYIHNGKAVIVR